MTRLLLPLAVALFALACEDPGGPGSPSDPAPPQSGDSGWGDGLVAEGGVRTMACGLTHCVAVVDGSLRAWGSVAEDEEWGLLDVPSGSSWVGVETDHWWSCAWDAAGATGCWGREGITSRLVREVPEEGVRDLALGTAGGAYVDAEGRVRAWGSDLWGQVSEAPREGAWVDVEAGYGWACGLDSTGVVGCWGITPEEGVDYVPHGQVEELPEGRFNALHGGTGSTLCATGVDGALKCWGGDGHADPLDGLQVDLVATSSHYTAAVTVDGDLVWAGEHQPEWSVDEGDVVDPPSWLAGDQVVDLACGHGHCCALAVQEYGLAPVC